MKNPERVAELLAELRKLAETDFERRRIDAVGHDLTEPLMPEIIDDTHQRFNGIVYKKTSNGHYNRALGIQQAVWIYFNGDIPQGGEIHHIDKDKSNNTLLNLQCLSKAEHTALHASTAPSREYVCSNCGKIFKSNNRAKNSRFCSPSCATAWFRANVKVEKICETCGKTFLTAKSRPARFCSAHCAGVFASSGNNRVPDEIRNEIRRLFVKGSREFGVRALARKFNINHTTVEKILRENQ